MKLLPFTLVAAFTLAASSLLSRAAEGTGTAAKPAPAATEAARPFKNTNPVEFDKLRSGTNTVVLDVRTPEEFSAGHIPGAINIDVNSPEFAGKVAKLDTNKTYLVNCALGGRSVKACSKLAPLNFGKLYNLQGGYDAWEKSGKPVEK